MATLTAKGACAALCACVLAGCSSQGDKSVPSHFAKRVRVAPDVRLWIECSGSGPVVLADGGLGIPTRAWVDSSNTLRVVAVDSRHLIQDDQPRLVAAALDEAGAFFPKKQRLRCLRTFAARRGRCAPDSP